MPAAPDGPPVTRQALERAHRSMPDDTGVALRLALACLQDDDAAAALALFEAVCARHDVAEAWIGLAASALRVGALDRAAEALQACLSRHVAAPTTRQLAAAVAGARGWCAMDGQGRLHADAPALLHLDGVRLRPRWIGGSARIPPGRCLTVERDGTALLGSPIDLVALNAIEGVVAAQDGGVRGWAWHPADPGRDPVITIAGRRIVVRQPQEGVPGIRPLGRPRQFSVPAGDLPAGPLHVRGTDGRDLLGSPLDPGLEGRAAAAADPLWAPVWADVVPPPNGALPAVRPVDVIVPVYGGAARSLACLASVRASLPAGSRLLVVDDASPDPALAAALAALAEPGRVLVLRQDRNRGYPAAVNAGMRAAAGRDVVLLNSDTLVPPGWIEALAAAARSAPGIGTACPLSNDATILSYPDPAGGNPMPDLPGTVALAALAAQANGAAVADIPVAHGFCMFIRRECLEQTGLFREDVFAQGYGEECDFALRARHRGWRHVAALGAYVAHAGGGSFGAARQHLQARNARVLARLHPGYDAMIAAWVARDVLQPARLRMDERRWRAGRRAQSVVLVTHGGGGGVDRVIAGRVAALRQSGVRPIVLRPAPGGVTVTEGEGPPAVRYPVPAGLPALARLLRLDRPQHVELHHLLEHDPALLGLPRLLGVPHEVHVHDYAWFCPRIALVQDRGYCGEPPVAACEACVADHGRHVEEAIPVAALVARSAGVLAQARRVVAPGQDTATRLQRHFPGLRATVTPWEDDAAIPPPPAPRRALTVCIIGGIGVEKGYDVLLACLRDAARRGLPLCFRLVGHSADDDRLLAAGPITITGRYRPEEAEALIRAQRADIAFLPSIWPETWCFTLGHAWQAGLRTAVFDLGTPAERVRRTGWGWVLPLGLPAEAVNDWLLRLDTSLQQKRSPPLEPRGIGVP